MKKVSIVISDLQAVLTALEEGRISMRGILSLINKEGNQFKKNSEETITLTVDYSSTIEKTIADGNYDRNNDDITEKNFPILKEMKGKKVEISTKLFHFNCTISSKDVKKKMDKKGYRPATLFELLVLGATHPGLQRQFPIIALGSVRRFAYVFFRVPYLDVDGDKRELSLSWLSDVWVGDDNRFLAVRK